jgi:hypothetical protein
MTQITYWGLVVFMTLLSLPPTADAFSRRSHHSEVMQTQSVTVPALADTIDGKDVSARAVPEPPALLLMSIGLGAFALCSAIKRFRKV